MRVASAMLELDWLTPDLAIGGAFAFDAAETLAREHRIAYRHLRS